jgi:ketosteroid isomerase-like protein
MPTPTALARGLAVAAALATVPTLALAASATGPVAVVHGFIDAFDRGDIAAAEATNAPDVSILDEMPPHEWHGAGAFQGWVSALGADAKAHDQSSQKVTLGPAIRSQIDGDTAYVVFQAVFSYREHGRAIAEPAQMVFALRDGAGGWKITSWAWSGAVPRAARR